MRDGVLYVLGHRDLNVWDGVRCNAPLAWIDAPLAPVWTATVSCKLVQAHEEVISLFTVYDGPDGAGALAFSFGPRTWSGIGVGYQSMNLQDYNGHDGRHCFLDADPFAWHELRMCKREDASRGSVFDFAFRPLDDNAQWIQCAQSVLPFRRLHGTRIALGLKQGGRSRRRWRFSEISFKDLSVVAGDGS